MDGGLPPRHVVLRTERLDEFRAQVSNLLTPHRLEPSGQGHGGMRAVVSRVCLGPVSLVYAEHIGTELSAQLTADVAYYDVNISRGGHNLITIDRDDVLVDNATVGVISPHMRASMRLSNHYQQLHVRIELAALERHLEGLLDEPVHAPIRFSPRMDLRVPSARSWAHAVQVLVGDVQSPDGLSANIEIANPWAQFVMTSLLLAQPHNYSQRLAATHRRMSRPQPLRRTIELIESSPDADLSVQRLAFECGVSTRSLQRQFREHLAVGPHKCVQEVRLSRAHEDLRQMEPADGRTVADVAFRWGFGNASRFASVYRRRYGVTPSVTRRQDVDAG